MKTSLPRFTIALIALTTFIALTCMEAQAQSNVFKYLFHGGTYKNASEREALYNKNDELPLRGLFAPGFTRTMTFLGGINFPSEGVFEDGVNRDSASILPVDNLSFPVVRNVDDSGYAISYAFGRRHSRKLRSEIEVAVRGNDINQFFPFSIDNIGSSDSEELDGSLRATSIMKNFIREFENESYFTPYVGFGIGISYIDVEFGEATSIGGAATFQQGETIFTYQAIGGVATKLTTNSDFIVEYRFLGTSEIEFDGLADTLAYNTSNLFMGLAFEY